MKFLHNKNLRWVMSTIFYYKRYFLEVVVAAGIFQMLAIVMPVVTQVIFDKVLVNKGLVTLDVLALGLVIVILFQAFMDGSKRILFAHTVSKIELLLGARLMRQILQLPLDFFQRRRTGNIMMKFYALDNIRQFLTKTIIGAGLDLIFTAVFFAMMLFYSWQLTLVALLSVPLLIGMNYWGMPRYRQYLKASWSAGARSQAFMVETIAGMETVKMLAAEPIFQSRWENFLRQNVQTNFSCAQFGTAMNESVSTVQSTMNLLVIWFGGLMVIGESVTIGQFVAFQMLANQAAAPLLRLSQVLQSWQQMRLSLDRMGDVLRAETEEIFRSDMAELELVEGTVEFSHVSFHYPLESKLVLRDISFIVPAGSCVGIVGRAGSGKSTLAKLLTRLYEPTEGMISLDAWNIAELSLPWLRKHVGMVLQQNGVFSGTVGEIIAGGQKQYSWERVSAAAEMAAAADFIEDMPAGYDTVLGKEGVNLSAGQRQRLAIARVLYQNPRVLIFDEASSALDNETEWQLRRNMRKIVQGRTVLIISHRLQMVRDCDFIIAMQDGKIVEQGRHEELLRNKGVYFNLWECQE